MFRRVESASIRAPVVNVYGELIIKLTVSKRTQKTQPGENLKHNLLRKLKNKIN